MRWSPDTCLCVIDTDDSGLATAALPCAAHAGLNPVALHQAVTRENQLKNRVYSTLVATLPEVQADAVAQSMGRHLMPGIEFEYAWDDARRMNVRVRGLDADQTAAFYGAVGMHYPTVGVLDAEVPAWQRFL